MNIDETEGQTPSRLREEHRAEAEPGVPERPGESAVAGLDGATPESSAAFHSVGFTVSTIGYAVARAFHKILAPLELEPREFALLRAVGASEGQSQQAIGERLQIPPSRMVAFIDALEARSLIERRHNPADRRTRALHLTPAGRELRDGAFALALAHEQRLCAGLSGAEREQLLALLQRVAKELGLHPGVHAAMSHSKFSDE